MPQSVGVLILKFRGGQRGIEMEKTCLESLLFEYSLNPDHLVFRREFGEINVVISQVLGNLEACLHQGRHCAVAVNFLEIDTLSLCGLEQQFEEIAVFEFVLEHQLFCDDGLVFVIKGGSVDEDVVDCLPDLEFLEQRRGTRTYSWPDVFHLLHAINGDLNIFGFELTETDKPFLTL